MFLVIVLLVFLLGAVVNIAFALAVFRDAEQCQKKANLLFVGPTLWCLATLLGGPFTAAIYWVLNHSTLNPHVQNESGASGSSRSALEHLYEEGKLQPGNEVDDAAVERYLE